MNLDILIPIVSKAANSSDSQISKVFNNEDNL